MIIITGHVQARSATASVPTSFAQVDLRQEFLSLYPNRHQSIVKPQGCEKWVTRSRYASLSDDAIWLAISGQEKAFWGCRWDDRVRFAVWDIDAGGQYHNELGLARIKHVLESVGITAPLLYQSSESGGWHLYLSWSEWVESTELFQVLKHWLQKEGFVIRQGELELFPSNNGLRFPLQKGFAWLAEDGSVLTAREDLSTSQAVERFLSDLDSHAHDWQRVHAAIKGRLLELETATAAVPNAEQEEDGFSAFFTMAGQIPEVYDYGRRYCAEGLTGPGQRHHAVLCVGHYFWYGDESAGIAGMPGIRNAGRRAEAIEAWLREKHNGFSKSVLRGDWKEIANDIRRACNWTSSEGRERAYESYALTERSIDRLEGLTKKTGRIWYPQDFQKGNIVREETAREKIRQALNELVNAGRRITVAGLSRLSGCKKETVRRHIDIWGALRLSKGPGDLSFGGRPALSPSCTALDIEKDLTQPSPAILVFAPDLVCGREDLGAPAAVQVVRSEEKEDNSKRRRRPHQSYFTSALVARFYPALFGVGNAESCLRMLNGCIKRGELVPLVRIRGP